jgi:hypothetical protein
MVSLLTGWLFGLLLGMRHALEVDHLAAISTFIAEHPGTRRAAFMGAWWGVGHALALGLVGAVLLALRAQAPPWLGEVCELGVALILLALGVRALGRALRGGAAGPVHEHEHGGHAHVHAGAEQHVHVGPLTLARKPLLVGLAHGMAGSGALTALALSSMPSAAAAAVYIALFGIGSIAAMTFLTAVAGLSLRRVAQRPQMQSVFNGVAGAASVLVGVVWGAPIVARFVAGLAV